VSAWQPSSEALTDEQIIRDAMATMRRYRRWGFNIRFASHMAARRMERLLRTRGAS